MKIWPCVLFLVLLLVLPFVVSGAPYEWIVVSNPIQNEATALTDVYMLSSSDGWAVGTGGKILHWNGATWSVVSSPTGETLNSVFMISSTDGWIVGHDGTILHWDGTTWNDVSIPPSFTLWDVFMLSNNNGWAVGAAGIIIKWDGTSWSPITSPTTSALYSVFMISPTDGWAVGEGEIIHWGGSSWSPVDDPLTENVYRSVFMIDSNEGWAVGSQVVEVGPGEYQRCPRIIHYLSQTSPAPNIWSSDSLGNPKDTFIPSETAYATVTETGQLVSLYVVVDKAIWNDGDLLTDVSDGVETLTLNSGAGTQTIQIWATPLIVGSYDVVMDVDNDGVFDEELDIIDSVTITGFNVIPEVPLGTVMSLLSMLIVFVVYVRVNRSRQNKQQTNSSD